MAIVPVQHKSVYGSGPLTLDSNVTAGNLLVAWISGFFDIDSTALPAGWVKLTPIEAAGEVVSGCLWYFENHPGGALSAVITNEPGDPGWSVSEYSGVATSGAFDKEATNSGTGTTGNTGTTPTTSQADELLYAALAQENTAFAMTFDAPFSQVTLETNHVHETGERIVSATGAYSATGTVFSSSVIWVGAIATFKAAGGAAPVVSDIPYTLSHNVRVVRRARVVGF